MDEKNSAETSATEKITERTQQSDQTSEQTSIQTWRRKKRAFGGVRAALVCLLICTLLCGVIYPVSVTLIAQTMFPYEANGSQITVTLADGSTRIYGSELIGQNYESPEYFFGRVNTGAPSNLSPQSEAYQLLVADRVKERKEKLAEIGYIEEKEVPVELVTASGSGVDPHISPEAAFFQIPAVVKARQRSGKNISEESVRSIVDKYTEGRFLWIFGEKRVNVLLVNLALDGLI